MQPVRHSQGLRLEDLGKSRLTRRALCPVQTQGQSCLYSVTPLQVKGSSKLLGLDVCKVGKDGTKIMLLKLDTVLAEKYNEAMDSPFQGGS